MAITIKVNPNRMELLKLKKRTSMAKRGHKLLKDKFDELMKQFLVLINKNRSLREEVERKLAQAYQLFYLTRAEAPIQVLEEALLYPRVEVSVDVSKKSLVGVDIISLKMEQEGTFDCYSLSTTPSLLDQALAAFQELLPSLTKLAELEKTVEMLALEIEKTRRRVNALEYVLIPQLDGAVRFITMKLDEIERSNLTRLMKIKEIVGERTA